MNSNFLTQYEIVATRIHVCMALNVRKRTQDSNVLAQLGLKAGDVEVSNGDNEK